MASPAQIVLHPVSVPRELRALPRIVARLSGDAEAIAQAAAGLPTGAATPEAVAARLVLAGEELTWGEPDVFHDLRALLKLCRARGASSVEVARADPSLLPHMELGSFFAEPWKIRVRRNVGLALPFVPALAGVLQRGVAFAGDLAFWHGVRSLATPREWARWTRSSYVVLYYHRIAGDGKPGQERLDVRPANFERQVKWLRRLRLRPVAPTDLLSFHYDANVTLPRRSFVLSADDAFRDAAERLAEHVDLRPYLFVNTSAVGRSATWAGGEAVASWDELLDLARRGAELASHAHTHSSLPDLDAGALERELTTSLTALQERLRVPPFIAYPHGRNDPRVRSAAAASGYRLAFTTETGRNGAGSDPYALRRVGLKDWDGVAALTWKALTGELVPWPLERVNLWLHRRGRGARTAARTS